MHIEQLSAAELNSQLETLEQQYRQLAERQLSLDLTRGKPGTEQVSLSNALDGILEGDFTAENGTDVRNYGGIDGLPEAKKLFSQMMEVEPGELLIGGNSSLTLMYTLIDLP